jgi:hypothetical protein
MDELVTQRQLADKIEVVRALNRFHCSTEFHRALRVNLGAMLAKWTSFALK